MSLESSSPEFQVLHLVPMQLLHVGFNSFLQASLKAENVFLTFTVCSPVVTKGGNTLWHFSANSLAETLFWQLYQGVRIIISAPEFKS